MFLARTIDMAIMSLEQRMRDMRAVEAEDSSNAHQVLYLALGDIYILMNFCIKGLDSGAIHPSAKDSVMATLRSTVQHIKDVTAGARVASTPPRISDALRRLQGALEKRTSEATEIGPDDKQHQTRPHAMDEHDSHATNQEDALTSTSVSVRQGIWRTGDEIEDGWRAFEEQGMLSEPDDDGDDDAWVNGDNWLSDDLWTEVDTVEREHVEHDIMRDHPNSVATDKDAPTLQQHPEESEPSHEDGIMESKVWVETGEEREDNNLYVPEAYDREDDTEPHESHVQPESHHVTTSEDHEEVQAIDTVPVAIEESELHADADNEHDLPSNRPRTLHDDEFFDDALDAADEYSISDDGEETVLHDHALDQEPPVPVERSPQDDVVMHKKEGGDASDHKDAYGGDDHVADFEDDEASPQLDHDDVSMHGLTLEDSPDVEVHQEGVDSASESDDDAPAFEEHAADDASHGAKVEQEESFGAADEEKGVEATQEPGVFDPKYIFPVTSRGSWDAPQWKLSSDMWDNADAEWIWHSVPEHASWVAMCTLLHWDGQDGAECIIRVACSQEAFLTAGSDVSKPEGASQSILGTGAFVGGFPVSGTAGVDVPASLVLRPHTMRTSLRRGQNLVGFFVRNGPVVASSGLIASIESASGRKLAHTSAETWSCIVPTSSSVVRHGPSGFVTNNVARMAMVSVPDGPWAARCVTILRLQAIVSIVQWPSAGVRLVDPGTREVVFDAFIGERNGSTSRTHSQVLWSAEPGKSYELQVYSSVSGQFIRSATVELTFLCL